MYEAPSSSEKHSPGLAGSYFAINQLDVDVKSADLWNDVKWSELKVAVHEPLNTFKSFFIRFLLSHGT